MGTPWYEQLNALGSLGLLILGAYTFWRSLTDKREEKTAELDNRINTIETFLAIVHDKFRRWRKE